MESKIILYPNSNITINKTANATILKLTLSKEYIAENPRVIPQNGHSFPVIDKYGHLQIDGIKLLITSDMNGKINAYIQSANTVIDIIL